MTVRSRYALFAGPNQRSTCSATRPTTAQSCAKTEQGGTKPVIPNRTCRKQPFSFNKRLYKLRWRIEAAFNRLKDFRRIATRYDKLARNYLASVCLAAALVWWI